MHWAVKLGDVELLQTLVNAGAHVHNETTSESRMCPIHWAASEGKVSSLNFLIDQNVDINVRDSNGCTPLIIATQHNMIPAIIFLIKKGANFDIQDSNGDTALHWAAYKGYLDGVGLLLYYYPHSVDHVDQFKQVHISSDYKSTKLIFAIQYQLFPSIISINY